MTSSSKRRINLSQAFWEEAREMIAGAAAEKAVQLMPADLVETIASRIPGKLLFDGDTRLKWASGIGLAFAGLGLETGWRQAAENFLVQGVEEVGKISATLDANNPEESRKAIRGALEKKRSLLEPLKSKQDQGDKVQKKASPDYFSAKAAIKDDAFKKTLSEIEQALKAADKDAYERFMRAGAYRIQTTPEELIDIAKASKEPDHTYGVERLKSLMSGQRGEGGVGGKLKSFTEDLVEDVFHGGGLDQAATTFDKKVEDSRKIVQDATAKRRRFQ
ncbi:hypothetical protein M0Q28_04005 [Patescibacteria group bacterium]|jgi:hypothetical protein|nr:hypothetical protein [Patescibacteria group bacterium]